MARLKTWLIAAALVLVLFVGITVFVVPLLAPQEAALSVQLYDGDTPVGNKIHASSIPLKFLPGSTYEYNGEFVTRFVIEFTATSNDPDADTLEYSIIVTVIFDDSTIDNWLAGDTVAFSDSYTTTAEGLISDYADWLPDGTFKLRFRGNAAFKSGGTTLGEAYSTSVAITLTKAGYTYNVDVGIIEP